MEQQREKLIGEAQRLAIIANAVAQVKLDNNETLVSEFGLIKFQKEDVLDEAQHLDALDHEEKVDFDTDENLVDMDAVSGEMLNAFGE